MTILNLKHHTSDPVPPMNLGCLSSNERHLQDLQRHLQTLGHQVENHLNLTTLQGSLQPFKWDVAMVDLTVLAEATLQDLRASFPRLLILALTMDAAALKVRALQLQADAALGMPADVEELEAQLHALWRFKHRQTSLHVQGWWLCEEVLYHQGRSVELTHLEARLLRFLMVSRGVARSRRELQGWVYSGVHPLEGRNVDMLIFNLRQKSPDLPLLTVYTKGYVFKA